MGLSVTDLYCGAGGSSLGARNAGDVDIALAINHWDVAVATHAANLPEAVHATSDLRVTSPAAFFATDILLASPSCPGHSKARQVKRPADPAAFTPDIAGERSRATAWDVLDWVDQHRYAAIIVENVIEFRGWSGHRPWLAAMSAFGYRHRHVYANSRFHHRTPQSRDRLYTVFWSQKLGRDPDLDLHAAATCATCGTVTATQRFTANFATAEQQMLNDLQAGRRKLRRLTFGMYGPWGQWRWQCPSCDEFVDPHEADARDVIDTALPITTLAGRSRPVPDALAARIDTGLRRYPKDTDFVVLNFTPGRMYPLHTQPINAITAQDQKAYLKVPAGYDRTRDGLGPLGYRRLQLDEVRRAMGFPDGYQLQGTATQGYRLLGNAVTPGVITDLVGRVKQALDSSDAPPVAA